MGRSISKNDKNVGMHSTSALYIIHLYLLSLIKKQLNLIFS